jgi:hypothetical protein
MDKRLISRIYKELKIKHQKNKYNPNNKLANELNRVLKRRSPNSS